MKSAGVRHWLAVLRIASRTVRPPALADCTPAQVQEVARSGQAANYWAVGDKIGIALSGTVAGLSLSGTYYAFIIGFNHNSSIEGNNTIHFQFCKTSDGTGVAFVYSYTETGAGFCINQSDTNVGGWASSYMRKTICPAFLAAMPTAWQNVIAACTKYSDNTGGGSNTASYVTATSDKIWLLAEFEVHGTRSHANSAEQNYQKQYEYYANGNSVLKYEHSDTTESCFWWMRSVRAANAKNFCLVNAFSNASHSIASKSYGYAPGFMVA